ncbi:MAG: putative metal-dependent hydrolase [Bacteroidia bacterium]|nr:putative metal-dependent hydrolase [Bacteroidia bacterium]
MKISDEELQALKYPIGPFKRPLVINQDHIKKWKQDLSDLPYNLRKVTAGMRDRDLDKKYRPGGWTGRQVIHHIADSHMNAYIRFKWALTEEVPMIKAYDEEAWAKLDDSKELPIDVSMKLIDALHHRWTYLIKQFRRKEWAKAYDHPDYEKPASLEIALAMYAWHSNHHIGHLQLIREQLKH